MKAKPPMANHTRQERGQPCPPVAPPAARAVPGAPSYGVPALAGPRSASPAPNPEPKIIRKPDAPNHRAVPPSGFRSQVSSLNPQPLLTRRDLAIVLRVSLRTIDRMLAAGDLPVLRIRNRIRFDLPAVLATLHMRQ